jgi:hypothetical protein
MEFRRASSVVFHWRDNRKTANRFGLGKYGKLQKSRCILTVPHSLRLKLHTSCSTDESIVPIFIERFLIVVCAAAFYGLVVNNTMGLDVHQRIGLGVILVGAAYLLGHTAYKQRPTNVPVPAATAPAEPSHASGDAKTTGSQSPAVTGDGNNIKYGEPSDRKKKTEHPKRSEP